MIMLRRPIDRETREVRFWNLRHEFGGDFPDMFFLGRRGGDRRYLLPLPTIVKVLDLFCVHVVLQLVQRCCKQGRDRLAGLLSERGQQAFLFRR